MPRRKPSEQTIIEFIVKYTEKVHGGEAVGNAERSLAKRLRAAGYAVPQRRNGPAARYSATELAAQKAAKTARLVEKKQAIAAWDAARQAKAAAEFPAGLFAAITCHRCRTTTMVTWKCGQQFAKVFCKGCARTVQLDRRPQSLMKI